MTPSIERQLYLSLKSAMCRCQFERDKLGVPVWSGVPLGRVQIFKCTRCVAVDEYEATHDDDGNPQANESIQTGDE